MPDVYQLSVTPVLRYSILAGIMGPWCKAISVWFIDLWAGSVLIHINVMTLLGWRPGRPTYRYWLFSSKNCGKMSGRLWQQRNMEYLFFLITGFILSIKEMVEEKRRIREGEGWPAWSWIPTFQTIKMPTINNVTFFVLGVTVITITGWPGILTLSSGSIKKPVWSSLVNL